MNDSKEKFEAFILVTLEPSMIKKTSQYLLDQDKIKNIHELYGQYDILLKVVADSAADLDDFCEQKLRHIAGIKGTETLIVSQVVKEGDNKTTGTNESEIYMLINTKYGKKRKVSQKLAKFHQVERVHELYGQFDILIKIKEATNKAIEDFIQKSIRSIGEIEDTETLVVADVP